MRETRSRTKARENGALTSHTGEASKPLNTRKRKRSEVPDEPVNLADARGEKDSESKKKHSDAEIKRFLEDYSRELMESRAELEAKIVKVIATAKKASETAIMLKNRITSEQKRIRLTVKSIARFLGPEFEKELETAMGNRTMLEELEESSSKDEADADKIAEYLTSAYIQAHKPTQDRKGKKRARYDDRKSSPIGK